MVVVIVVVIAANFHDLKRSFDVFSCFWQYRFFRIETHRDKISVLHLLVRIVAASSSCATRAQDFFFLSLGFFFAASDMKAASAAAAAVEVEVDVGVGVAARESMAGSLTCTRSASL